MSHSDRSRLCFIGMQRGAVAVEFALIAALFLLTLLVGILELGRVFYYMNATAEATRLGARMAVVCDKSPAQQTLIEARMQEYLNVLPDGYVVFDWLPSDECTSEGPPRCESVTVRIRSGATFDTLIPFVPLTWTLPPFATTLPRESMSSEGGTNPVCH